MVKPEGKEDDEHDEEKEDGSYDFGHASEPG